jgi:hypothetical protein
MYSSTAGGVVPAIDSPRATARRTAVDEIFTRTASKIKTELRFSERSGAESSEQGSQLRETMYEYPEIQGSPRSTVRDTTACGSERQERGL